MHDAVTPNPGDMRGTLEKSNVVDWQLNCELEDKISNDEYEYDVILVSPRKLQWQTGNSDPAKERKVKIFHEMRYSRQHTKKNRCSRVGFR